MHICRLNVLKISDEKEDGFSYLINRTERTEMLTMWVISCLIGRHVIAVSMDDLQIPSTLQINPKTETSKNFVSVVRKTLEWFFSDGTADKVSHPQHISILVEKQNISPIRDLIEQIEISKRALKNPKFDSFVKEKIIRDQFILKILEFMMLNSGS